MKTLRILFPNAKKGPTTAYNSDFWPISTVLRPNNPFICSKLRWIRDSDLFSYLESAPEIYRLIIEIVILCYIITPPVTVPNRSKIVNNERRNKSAIYAINSDVWSISTVLRFNNQSELFFSRRLYLFYCLKWPSFNLSTLGLVLTARNWSKKFKKC